MRKPIPDLIAPAQAAAQNKHYQFTVPQQQFPRLMGMLHGQEGTEPVEVDLRFFVEPESGLPAFKLRFKSQYPLQCQRTLEDFLHPVEETLQGVFVDTQGAEKLVPEDYDVWPVETSSIKPWQLIEDELLLAVPIVPKKPGSALVWRDEEAAAPQADEVEEKPDNPFSVLQALKDQLKN